MVESQPFLVEVHTVQLTQQELKDIKYLFNYDRGRVISEQQLFEDDQEDFNRDAAPYSQRDMSDTEMETGEDLAPSFD